MLWYDGPTVFERLVESAANQRGSGGLRFAVQRVARARFGTNADLRGLQGQMLGGVLAVGETVMIAPARHMARVAYIYRSTQPVEQCVRGDAVTVVLDGQHDVARGDALVGMDAEPMIATRWQASLCWLDAESMLPGRRYWLKHTTRTTRAMVEGDATLINVCDLHESSTSGLKVNDVARVTISTQHPLVADRYLDNRDTGSFILIDDATHRTVAAGMLVGALDERLR
jgi:sulfate adenylyltransferase subunit 1 (EFTu-like GTPase family)